MSRTDRHRPDRVQLADRWEVNTVFGAGGQPWLLHRSCGHPGCSLRPESRIANRRERYAARRANRDARESATPAVAAP